MLEGSLWNKLIVFALPLAFTGMLQQLYNAADVAVLGRFVSDLAVAAVGNNVPVIGLIISFCMGLSLGVNVVVAHALGMKNDRKASEAVRTSFLTAIVFGIIALIIGLVFSDAAMDWLEVPAEVRDHALIYLRVYLLGMPFIAIYNFLAAIFRSQGDTQTPLWALLAASLFNIAGNLFAVLVLDWGIAGVALATVLANLLSAIILFVKLTQIEGPLKLEVSQLLHIDSSSLKSIVRIGLPAGIQGAVYSLSNLVIQSAINSLGPAAMAGSVAAFTIEINVYCFINAFSLAATTFVSQNYGARNLDRCYRVMWVTLGLNMCVTILMTALVLVFSRDLLGIFTNSEEVIALGLIRILWVVLPQPLSVVMDTLSGCMRGYGYSLPPAMVTLVVVCSVRLIWVYTAFPMAPTYETLMMVYPLSWVITMAGLIILYVRLIRRIKNRRQPIDDEI
ncbi:MAG TPA: MATE family efflux transporter [Candidatus Aphodousia faecipullorum]|nr:MATE family efflux transporter [Candidatus Aphodousia faecipullorum]